MSHLDLGIAIVLLASVGVGLLRVFRLPGGADVVLAVLLLGTTGVAAVLVLGKGLGVPRAVDIALVVAALAAVLGVAFAQRGWPDEPSQGGPAP